MDHFHYSGGEALCEKVPLARLAEEVGTPVYVYSAATLERHCLRLKEAFKDYPTLPCFAVKALSNLSILKRIFSYGFGADLVSVGELERALLGGARPENIIFSGVGKRRDEIRRALEVGIKAFNVESEFELALISEVAAEMGKVAPVSLRINPNIDVSTHPKIATGLYSTKFGLVEAEARALWPRIAADSGLELVGLGCHIGSQITDLTPLGRAAERMAALAKEALAADHALKFLDMGGGLGIRYRDENPPALEDYAKALIAAVRPTGLTLLIEPGRVLVGNVGVLLTRCLGVKSTPEREFVIVDAAMNDLIRPTLYDSFHEILPVREKGLGEEILCDVVGPICETGDILGKTRRLPRPRPGDLLYIRGAGAYAASMASQYNSRPRAPEVLVDGATYRVVRNRERLEDLWAAELEALKNP